MVAAKLGRTDIVKMLIRAGASVHFANSNVRIPHLQTLDALL
jgi:ankyrin repeat protein